jgi:hypothetical protein
VQRLRARGPSVCGGVRDHRAARADCPARDADDGRLLRADDPLGALAQLPRDLDRFAGQHQPRGLEQYLVLRRSDLGLNDLDREIFPAQQPSPRDTRR